MSNQVQGQFFIDSLSIVNQYDESVDIKNLATNFKLYESIYNKFITGEISIIDGLDLLKNYRFTGQEFIRFSIKQAEGVGDTSDSEFSIDKTFRIYKVDNINRMKDTIQTYVLRFCDPKMLTVRKKKISKVMRGRYDQMLQNLLIDEANFRVQDFDLWEETSPDNKQFLAPNLSIVGCMDYIIANSNTDDNGAYRNSCFFYQSVNGGFRFASFETMASMEFPLEFSYSLRNNILDTDEENINSEKGLNTQILRLEKPEQFNTLEGTVNGAYSSFMRVYDPIRKIEEEDYYDMKETFDRNQKGHISGYPMMMLEENERIMSTHNLIDGQVSPDVKEIDVELPANQEYDALIHYDQIQPNAFDNSSTLGDAVYEGRTLEHNGVLERKALMEMLQQNRLIVTIPFRTDISAGIVIKLNIPSSSSAQDGGDREDKVNDNRYLITDIAFSGDPMKNQGVCNLEVVKESYARDISKEQPLENVAPPRET